MFFGTPHGGGNVKMVRAGELSAKVARALMLKPQTDLFKALQDDSVFSEQLKTYFRNQHEKYQIVSFYERLSNVSSVSSKGSRNLLTLLQIVPSSEAAMFMSSTREDIIGLDATHSDLCRFDANAKTDRKILKMVLGNLVELYEKAVGSEGESERLPEVPQALPQPDTMPETATDDALARRLEELRR